VLADQLWNRALCDHFYHARLAGRPAYFYVDRETIESIAKQNHLAPPGRGFETLTYLVYSQITSAPLMPWVHAASAWKKSGYVGSPPFLTALAVTVLAANDVDLGGTKNSYYPQLRALLKLPRTGGMPKDFDNDVAMLWKILNKWLEDGQGSLGIPTAKPGSHYANVGWAMSQVLLPPVDRVRLPQFFTVLGVDPGEELPGALLLAQLRELIVKRRMIFSRRLTSIIQRELDETTSELLAEVLRQELLNWDGNWRNEDGRQLIPLLLAADEFEGQLCAVFRVPERLAGAMLRFREREVALGKPGDFEFIPSPNMLDVLTGADIVASSITPAGSVEPEIERFRLVAPQSELRILAGNDDLGMYLEGHRPEIDLKLIVLVREHLASPAFDAMSQLGNKAPGSAARLRPPAGWVAFKYRPKRSITLEYPLTLLVPRDTFLASFTGGLCIDGRSHTYLVDGPPDISISSRELGGPVILNECITLEPDENGRISLAGLGLLPGTHKVNASGRTLTLRLLREVPPETFAPTYWHGWNIRPSVGEHRLKYVMANNGRPVSADSGHDVLVNGALLRISEGDVVNVSRRGWPEVRSGGRHVALGIPGLAQTIIPEVPAWLSEHAPTAPARMLDVSKAVRVVDFRPLWVLRETPGRVEVHRLPDSVAKVAKSRAAASTPGRELWWSVAKRLAEAIIDPQDLSEWSKWLTEAELLKLLPEV